MDFHGVQEYTHKLLGHRWFYSWHWHRMAMESMVILAVEASEVLQIDKTMLICLSRLTVNEKVFQCFELLFLTCLNTIAIGEWISAETIRASTINYMV